MRRLPRRPSQETDRADSKWAMAREIPHLRRYALALVRDPTAADDLVQDCLERALRKRHLWRRTGSIRSWLFRILYTTYLNGRARSGRRGRSVDIETVEGRVAVPAPQEGSAYCREVLSALERLPDEQRVAILLVALEGLSYDEVASILSVPIGTVRSRLWRGREALSNMSRPSDSVVPLRRLK